ncbi:MAG: hypothetical protein HY426_01790 [Candidatus Levybacteria bacterium]|nr:hypothetical protein [Candidatus Levybacteria bacterium]
MKNLIKIFALGLIGAASLYFVIWATPIKKNFSGHGKVEVSSYGMTFYGNFGNIVFSLSPLNDYYYDFSHKEHVFSKLTGSKNRSLIDQALITAKGLFLNKKELVWEGVGENSRGEVGVRYEIKYVGKSIEIRRKIEIKDSKFTNIGEAIKICPGCLVTDDKGRLFFNGDLVNEDKLNLATDLKKVLFAVGKNQSFPANVSKIMLLNRDGKTLLEIPITDQEIFFEEEWGIVEFKTNFNMSKGVAKNTQIIRLNP